MAQTTEVAKKEEFARIADYLKEHEKEILQVLPAFVKPDRLMRVSLSVISRNKDLLKCTPISVFNALMAAGQLGLEPTGRYGGSWLVAFKNGETGLFEAMNIYDYRGMMNVARRTGEIDVFDATCVYEGDHFEYERGLNPTLVHRPKMTGQHGPLLASYAIVRFKSGRYQFEVMTKADIESIRLRSRAREKGPWVTDYDRMAMKSVVRRICNLLPYSVELADLLAADDEAEGYATPHETRRGVTGLGNRLKVVTEPQPGEGAPAPAAPTVDAQIEPRPNSPEDVGFKKAEPTEEEQQKAKAEQLELAEAVRSGARHLKMNGAWLKAKIKARGGSILMTGDGSLDLDAQPAELLRGLLKDLEAEMK